MKKHNKKCHRLGAMLGDNAIGAALSTQIPRSKEWRISAVARVNK